LRIAATSWATVSWVATASSSTVESNARPAVQDPDLDGDGLDRLVEAVRVAPTPFSRLRQYTSTVWWNAGSSNASPAAAFQRISVANAVAAWPELNSW